MLSAVVFIASVSALAAAQQNSPPPVAEKPDSWLVSVIHEINIEDLLRSEGMSAAPVDGRTIQITRNITTGLVIDASGRVLTRLVNLNRFNARPSVRIKTGDGRILTAQFVGADRATGLTLLEVPGLGIEPPGFATAPPRPDELVIVKSPEFSLKATAWQERNGTRAPASLTTIYEVLVQNGRVLPANVVANPPHMMSVELPSNRRIRSDLNAEIILNASGQVLGMTLRTFPVRNSVIKQALQIDQAREIAGKLLAARQSTPKLWLGALGADLSQFPFDEREILDLPKNSDGVIVTSVMPGSPAWTAGLKLNDILVGVGENQIHSLVDIQKTLSSLNPGEPTQLFVFRDNRPVTLIAKLQPADFPGIYNIEQQPGISELEQLQVKLRVMENRFNELAAAKQSEAARIAALQDLMKQNKERLNEATARFAAPPAPAGRALPLQNFGVTIQDLTAQLAEFFGVAGQQGVLVTAVDPRGLGAKAGIRAGDIILKIDGKPVPPETFLKPAAQKSSMVEFHRLLLVRDRKPLDIPVQVVAKPENNLP